MLYSSDIMPSALAHLCFDKFAPGLSFHAALVPIPPRRSAGALHTHDFAEMMYVLQGTGTHWIGGKGVPVRAGSLVLVRPHDCHTLGGPSGSLHFINIAFRAEAWREFCRAAGLEEAAHDWDAASDPPAVSVAANEQAACAQAFRDILHDFHECPTRLALCRFWTRTLPYLLPSEEAGGLEGADDLPPWLARACAAMAEPDNLRAGVGRMAEIAGVGKAHLARTLQARRGQTPTEFLLQMRLAWAAALLRTGVQEIANVALDCGFDNLSYFYRCFRARYGQTPHTYRHDPRHKILPLR